jgi:hypothetical protein
MNALPQRTPKRKIIIGIQTNATRAAKMVIIHFMMNAINLTTLYRK